jgi:hypothetical protein
MLIELGYEQDKNWTQEKHSSPKLVAFKERLDKACEHYNFDFRKSNVTMYLKNINSILADYKVVFYGTGSYMHRVLKLLDHKHNIVFCVDDNPQRAASNIEGIPVYKSDALIDKFMTYDLVMLTVNPQYNFDLRHNLNQFEFPSYKIVDAYNHDVDIFTLSDLNILRLQQELNGNGQIIS